MHERELNPREPDDRDLVISEWLRYAESGKEDGSWAYDALADLIDEDPALALRDHPGTRPSRLAGGRV